MDRNNVIGLVLIAIILIGYSIYTVKTAPKVDPKTATEQTQQLDSLAATNPDTAVAPTTIAATDTANLLGVDSTGANLDSINAANKLTQQYGSFATAVTGTDDTFVLENKELRITFGSRGGNIESIELKNYKTHDKQPLYLAVPGDQKLSIELNTNISSTELYYTSSGIEQNDNSQKLTLTATTANGGTLQHIYTLPAEGFLLDYDLALNKLEKDLPRNANYLMVNWTRKVPQVEKNKDQENSKSKLFFRDTQEGVDYLSETGNEEATPDGKVSWVSYTQAFFNTTLIAGPEVPFYDLKLNSSIANDTGYLKEYATRLAVPYNLSGTQTYDWQYYLGPNHYQTLNKMDIELEEVINLGSGIMAWVSIFNKWIIIPIFNFLEGFIGNYGVIILILTLIIKIVLFPLTYKSYLSQAKMKVLKPEIDALKEKYKDDQQKFTQEQMKLWGKAGVNPLGGCLPTLLQMPILVAMYYFFPSSIELRQEKFLWADDLSTYDSIWDFPNGFDLWLYGDHVSLFTLLMTVTSIIYAVSNARLTGQQEGPLKYMPYIFPIMLLGIFNSFPAALTYYYFLANVISYAQQWAIKQFFIDDEALHKQMQEKKAKPTNPNSFSSRMGKVFEQAQKSAQEQQQQKKAATKKK